MSNRCFGKTGRSESSWGGGRVQKCSSYANYDPGKMPIYLADIDSFRDASKEIKGVILC